MASTTTFHVATKKIEVIRETDWTRMDNELKTLLKPIQDKLSLKILTSEEAAVEFSDTLIATLEKFGKDMKPRKGQHRKRPLEKAVSKLRIEKRAARKDIRNNNQKFVTIINVSENSHQEALYRIDEACRSLDLKLNLQKCVSIFINKGKPKKKSFELLEGNTRPISEAPTKFLGKVLGQNKRETLKYSSNHLKEKLLKTIQSINQRPIRGEMKVWLLKNYVMPSLHFHLAVNQVKQTTIQMLEDIIAKTMKKWPRLPRSATRALLHHPAIISSVPQVSLAYNKAKISILSALASTTDPIVEEVNELFKDPKFQTRQGIPKETNGWWLPGGTPRELNPYCLRRVGLNGS